MKKRYTVTYEEGCPQASLVVDGVRRLGTRADALEIVTQFVNRHHIVSINEFQSTLVVRGDDEAYHWVIWYEEES